LQFFFEGELTEQGIDSRPLMFIHAWPKKPKPRTPGSIFGIKFLQPFAREWNFRYSLSATHEPPQQNGDKRFVVLLNLLEPTTGFVVFGSVLDDVAKSLHVRRFIESTIGDPFLKPLHNDGTEAVYLLTRQCRRRG